jgi:hypothetical protein
MFSDGKYAFLADSALACAAKTIQRLLAEFQFPANWSPYSPNLNFLDFYIPCILQAKVQAVPHSNLATLRLSIAEEWDQSQKMPLVPQLLLKLSLRKMKFKLNRWSANSPAHTCQYFSGLKLASIRHQGLSNEKIPFQSTIGRPTLYVRGDIKIKL